MTPHTFFDIVLIVGCMSTILGQHVAMCALRKQLAVYRSYRLIAEGDIWACDASFGQV